MIILGWIYNNDFQQLENLQLNEIKTFEELDYRKKVIFF